MGLAALVAVEVAGGCRAERVGMVEQVASTVEVAVTKALEECEESSLGQ